MPLAMITDESCIVCFDLVEFCLCQFNPDLVDERPYVTLVDYEYEEEEDD